MTWTFGFLEPPAWAVIMFELIDGYEPRYDIRTQQFSKDLAFGQDGEHMFAEFLADLEHSTFEVKYDRYRNGKMCVETEHCIAGHWELSGLNVTTAKWWVYVFAPHTFTAVQTARLKKYLRHHKLPKEMFNKHTATPTRGFLLLPEQVTDLLTHPDYDTEMSQ